MRLQLATEQIVHLQVRNLAEGRPSGLAAYLLLPVMGAPTNRPFQGMCVRTESEIQHSCDA